MAASSRRPSPSSATARTSSSTAGRTRPKLRNIAHSPRVSFHLQSDPYGDHWLIIEGLAEVDRTIPPLVVHERYGAKYTEPHAHWGLDFTRTALDFEVPIRIHPTRIRGG